MEIVLMLLCIAGIAFAIKQVDGPFNLFAKIRNMLPKLPLVGPLFFHLLSCHFCLGFWSSVGVFFAANGFGMPSLGKLAIFAFGGGMFNLLFHKVVDKLNNEE